MGETVAVAVTGVPTCTFDALWHVGSLNPAHKGSWSLEGRGLSVSRHPDEWTEIAELGGNPVWEFTRAGNVFLDYHALTTAQREQITAWGAEHGYVELRTVFVVSWYDEDIEDRYFMRFLSRDEADEEAEVYCGEDGTEWSVAEVVLPVATDAFPDPTVRAGDIDPHQILTVVWAAAQQLHFDGVWWEDTYDPASLSCPRGVIHAGRVADWTVLEAAGS